MKMVLRVLCFVLMISATLVFAETAKESPKTTPKQLRNQTICPVMKNPIDSSVFTDIQGQRIYMCCWGCEKKLKANPDKYFEEAAKEGILFENVQKVCPVTGKPIDKNIFIDYRGRRVYFSDDSSITIFKKDPKIYLAKLDEQMIPKKK
jgi:YHS domain-containing protein